MQIGIIGSGNMGRAIGVRFAQIGHDVLFGARRSEQAINAAERAGNGAMAGSNDDAATFGEAVVWTTREVDAARVLRDEKSLANKPVIDLNNRDYADSVAKGELPDRSFAERLQESLPQAHVVKAFNAIPLEMFDCTPGDLRAVDAQTFIAGGDPGAKRIVGELAIELGFRAIDLGGGDVAFRAAEALADVARLLIGDAGYGFQAHLRLDRLPEPTLAAVGPRHPSLYN